MDQSFMELALKQAALALQADEVPIGAIIVKDGEIVGQGFNQKITLNNALAHAEIMAINQASKNLATWNLNYCTLYVTLEPCAMCVGALVHARLKRLVFGAYDPKSGACGSAFALLNQPYLNHQLLVTGGVLADKCGQLLVDFFHEKRK